MQMRRLPVSSYDVSAPGWIAMSVTAQPGRVPLAPDSRDDADDGEINILRLLSVLLRYFRLIVAVGFGLAVFTLFTGLTTPRSYSADASFIPQGARAPSAGSAIAAQFGLGGLTAEGGQSSQFYVDLIHSREILRGVVHSAYTVRTDTGVVSGDLIRVFGVKGQDPRVREATAMSVLRGRVSASPSLKTGVIKVTVMTANAELSAQIVGKVLEQINRFNLEGRQSRATAEREFTLERLREAEAALIAAEDRLEGFLRSNRVFDSPSLSLQRERLNRNVLARQEVYTALAQAAEQARIEEVRDTPAITVIEPPTVPLAPISRGTKSRTIRSFVFGLLLGTFLAFLLDYARRSGARDAEAFREFKSLLARSIRIPFRRRPNRATP